MDDDGRSITLRNNDDEGVVGDVKEHRCGNSGQFDKWQGKIVGAIVGG